MTHTLLFESYKQHIDSRFENTTKPSRAIDEETGREVKSWLVHFTSSFLERVREVLSQYNPQDAMELHDILPVWFAIEHPWPPSNAAYQDAVIRSHPFHTSFLADGWETTRRKFEIERTGSLTRGMLVIDRRSKGVCSSDKKTTLSVSGCHNRAIAHKQQEQQGELGDPAQATQEHIAPTLTSDQTPDGVQKDTAQDADALVSGAKPGYTANDTGTVGRVGDLDTEEGEGILYVNKTPGENTLLRLMFERIWGVKD